MSGNEVNQIVEKLAEKIGVAADKLVPLAEETIRQVSRLGMIYTFIWSGMALFSGILLCLWCGCTRIMMGNPDNRSEGDIGTASAGFIVFSVLFIICIAAACSCGMSRWIAPIPYLLGK